MCRLGQVQSGSAPCEGAMEEPAGWSRGTCRLRQVQSGPTPGEGAMREPRKSQEAGVGAGTGFYIYRGVQHLVREP